MNKPIHFVTAVFKQWRKDHGYTQAEMADFLSLQFGRSVQREHIKHWETGDRGFTAEKALELAKAMNIPTGELFSRK